MIICTTFHSTVFSNKAKIEAMQTMNAKDIIREIITKLRGSYETLTVTGNSHVIEHNNIVVAELKLRSDRRSYLLELQAAAQANDTRAEIEVLCQNGPDENQDNHFTISPEHNRVVVLAYKTKNAKPANPDYVIIGVLTLFDESFNS